MQLDTMYPEGVRGVVFVHNFHTYEVDTLSLRHIVGQTHKDIRLRDEITRLSLDAEGTKVLGRRLVNAMLDQWATDKVRQFFYGSMWGSAIMAVRIHLPEETELLKKVLLAAVVYEGGHEKHTLGLIRAILPNPDYQKSTLQDVIDYLLEVGCTEAEIRAAWGEMIRTRQRENFKIGYIVSWWEGLKIGKHGFQKEVEEVARQRLLYELHDILVQGYGDWNAHSEGRRLPEDYLQIIDFLLTQVGFEWYYSNKNTQELVESYFVECVARGKVGVAFYMLVRYGKSFCLYSEYASQNEPHRKPNGAMERLMRAAIEKAEEKRTYGIAAALAEHIDDAEVADRNREMARSLKQRVALDFAFYHAVDMNK